MKPYAYVTTDANGQLLPEGDLRDASTNIVWRHLPKKAPTQQKAVKMADVDGMHLPTIDELETLRDRTICNPASSFPGIKSDWYWSSTLCADDESFAWYVSFSYGLSGILRRNHDCDGSVLACRPASQ